MRIGILTFHSEINYGSVLQAYALQTHLQSLGHDVVIIDKWENADNRRLLGPFSKKSVVFWCKYLYHGLLLSGALGRIRRHIKTYFMIRRYLKLTSYHFYRWDEAPKDLGVDVIVVGSDQVWNPIIVDPPDYLLKSVPSSIPGIAYAASIGQHELDERWKQEYIEGFRRFVAIGVREKEAKQLVEATGSSATHVVDPTLLVDSKLCWNRFLSTYNGKKPRLFCYLMTQDVAEVLPLLSAFSKKMKAEVDVFLNNRMLPVFGKNFKGFKRWASFHKQLTNGNVRICLSAAPNDFVRQIAQATWVITESFHGLMFSTIFRKNVRVVQNNKNAVRKAMSARLTEFSDSIISGPLMASSMEGALSSLASGETIGYNERELDKRISMSRKWLESAIEMVASNRAVV